MVYLGTLLGTVIVLAGVAVRDKKLANVPWLKWLAINLTLAWVPLLLSSLAGVGGLALLLIVPAWLLFLPNAPYLVTDLKYLGDREHWVDIVLLSSVAALGLWIGALSVFQMIGALCGSCSPLVVYGLYAAVSAVAGFGVYLGRMLRWNSWSIITKPRELIADVVRLIRHPIANLDEWAIIMTFGAIFSAAICLMSFVLAL